MEPHPEHAHLLPGGEDIARYREDGYWISPVILSDEVLDAAERGMARFYAGDVDHDTAGVPDPPPPEGLRKHDYASLRVDELARLVTAPVIARTAALLSGAATIRLWHDQLLYKPADSPGAPANVGWHTDRQYWRSCTSDAMLTAWIGFHDVDEDGGAVRFMAGSHRWEVSGLDFYSQDLDALQAHLAAQGHRLDIRPARMRRGQVSFHHCRTVHGSGPNRGTAPRRSIAVHLQPGDNRWRARTGPDGRPVRHGNDDLVRAAEDGAPDYADPLICPRLWPPVDR
ncbi:phytanoyl-CoA dioxygenase family protein [Streptomyces sp. TS71-3]|uniref:phytanoyl-CoA dioxygenase family protein n=1 Tax=Streptomyces sp. TS71-3 TaxID=2733862 RepID=UPI001B16F4B1|nr:phytanoyl-CoA dioxygenase family protein [Streptomyces sp. TS71-3]GHJ41345.1 phytanoyl-CoA dioxygenase [Streptomyces sp. TS71-3]